MTRVWRHLTVVALLLGFIIQGTAAVAAAPTLQIVSPAAGASVTGTSVTIQVQVSGVTLRAADGSTDPAFGHLHYFIDRQPDLTPGAPVPFGPKDIIHSAETSVTINDLAPGQHTVTVVLGLGSHQITNPPVSDTVTFTVAAPAAPTATPAPAAKPQAPAPQPTAAAAPTAAARAGQPATGSAPQVTGLPQLGLGGGAGTSQMAWWSLVSGALALAGLRGFIRRR